jgi:hypothetical protein
MARGADDDGVNEASSIVRRYFFDVDEGGARCADQVGVFLSPADVEQQASDYVVDMARLDGKRANSGRIRTLRVVVRNDRGQLVVGVELSLKLKKATQIASRVTPGRQVHVVSKPETRQGRQGPVVILTPSVSSFEGRFQRPPQDGVQVCCGIVSFARSARSASTMKSRRIGTASRVLPTRSWNTMCEPCRNSNSTAAR